MSILRTNQAWLQELSASGDQRNAAIEDLRRLLLRAALFSFQHNLGDLANHSPEEIHQLAEDCAQEALIAVLDNLPSFRGESKFTTWAYKFAINISLTMARLERWKEVSLDVLAERASKNGWLLVDESTSHFDRSALDWEIWETIAETIRRELTEKQRFVLTMIVFEEVPMDVVVQRMNSNRNAVYKLLHDARRKLKRKLQAQGIGLDEIIKTFRTYQ
jgi:RNA polymerase sigma-70 factor (ECF subfamily)